MNSTAERSSGSGRAPGFLLLLLLGAAALAGVQDAGAQTRGTAAPTAPPTIKEAKLPGTPLGKLAAAYLRVFNSGSRDALRDFIAAHYSEDALRDRSAETRTAQHWSLYRSLGSLTVYRTEEPSQDELQVWARAQRSGEWMRLRFSAAPGKPLRLPGIIFEPVLCPLREVCPAGLTDAQVVAELTSYLDELSASDAFAGVVLVARGDTPLFEKAYGASPWQAPNQPSSRFALASMGKMFVAVAVAQLEERGHLSFQDPIHKFFPEHPRQITDRVTVHHLLTHTSGLASFVDAEGYAEVQSLSPQDSLAVFFRRGLSFQPGERWQYSNAGYITLEAVVERVSHQSFSVYLQEQVFQPAGMRDTYGGFTSARDLLRFAGALRENKLLSRENTANLMKPRIQTTWADAGYGYGFAVLDAHGQRIVGHSGASPGWNGQLDIYWGAPGYTVVVLADREVPIAQRVAVRLRDLLNRR